MNPVTPLEPSDEYDEEVGSGFDQRAQNIYGPQANFAGGQHVHHYYGKAKPVAPRQSRCDFYAHVLLPPNYVPRLAVLAEIREALLGVRPHVALTSMLRQADALFGMGGIGKTVMARALCEDEAVQTTFVDGILWATLGQTPDVAARLREWVSALGGSIPPTALTPESLTNLLAQVLQGRRCLLIVDDVWEQEHLACFLVNSPGCRLLFTTRNAEIANEMQATIRPVPVMARTEAITLLTEWAGTAVATATPAVQEAIINRLGRLPLALKLAGDQLRRHTPERWLATFDAHKLSKRRPKDVHDSLETTFALSLADLTVEERQLFNGLAIFKDDEAIPLLAIAKLWSALGEYTDAATVDLVHYLVGRALLQLATAQESEGTGSEASLTVTVHDLLRDFMTAELGAEGRQTGHLALLAAYRVEWTSTQDKTGWPSVPDDGYLYDHLVYHLSEAAQEEPRAYRELLALFGSPVWLQVRVPAANYRYDGYLRDVGTAWAVCAAMSAEDRRQTLPWHVRFALLRTTLNSLAANYGPSLVGYAVEMGIWPVARALSIFGQTPDPLHKAQLGAALLDTGKLNLVEQGRVLQQSLEHAAWISLPDQRLRAIVALCPYLQEEARQVLVDELIGLVATLATPERRGQALTLLVPFMTLHHHGAALQCIDNLGEAWQQVVAVIHMLALGQGVAMERQKALRKLLSIADETMPIAGILVQLGRRWPLADDHYDILLPAIFEESSRDVVNKMLRDLITFPRREYQARVLSQAFATAVAIQDEEQRSEVLRALAPHLHEEQHKQALTTALVFWDERQRTEILCALVPQLQSNDLVQQVLAAALVIRDEGQRTKILYALAPQLHDDAKSQQTLAAVLAIRDEWRRAEVLRALALHLHGEQQEQVRQQVLTAALAIQDERWRAEILQALAPHLRGEAILQQVLTATLAISLKWWRLKVLQALAPRLHDEVVFQQALTVSWALSDEQWRADVLQVLAPHLHSEAVVQQVLTAAQAIQHEEQRVKVLQVLLPHLHGEQYDYAVHQALTAAQAIQHEERRAKVLQALAPYLHGEVILQQALAAVMAIRDEERRAKVLQALAPYLHGEVILQQALAVALAIRDKERRIAVLRVIARYMHGEQREQALQQALAATLTIPIEWKRSELLQVLAPHLSGEIILQEALTAALAIQDEGWRATALYALAPHLSGEIILQEALTAALAIQDEGWRATVLYALAPHLGGEQQEHVQKQALTSALAIQEDEGRAAVLRAIIPRLHEKQQEQVLQQALAAALAILEEGKQAGILQAIIREVSQVLRPQALVHLLKATLALTDDQRCKQMLIWLSVHLSELPVAACCCLLEELADEWRQADYIDLVLPYLNSAVRPLMTQSLPTLADQINRNCAARLLSAMPARTTIERQLQAASTIGDEYEQMKNYAVLIKLLPRLQQHHFSAASEHVWSQMGLPSDLATAQLYLVFVVDEKQRAHLITQCLTLATAIAYPAERMEVLINLLLDLAPIEQETVIEHALEASQGVSDVKVRANLLVQLIVKIALPVKKDVVISTLAAVMEVWEPMIKVDLLVRILPRLTDTWRAIVIRWIYQDARDLDGAEARARAFAVAAANLAGDARLAAFHCALSAAAAIENDTVRCAVLVQLTEADRSGRALREAKRIATTVLTGLAQAEAIVEILPLVGEMERPRLVRRGLRAALGIKGQRERATMLARYLPYVRNPQPIYNELCLALIERLRAKAQRAKRGELLMALAEDPLFTMMQLPSEVLVAMGETIGEICDRWEWL